MNIVDPILFQCKLNPPAAAICAPGTTFNVVSYGRLERFIHNVSRVGLSLGLEAGQIVAISVKDTIFHVAIILGLTRLGVITLSASELNLPKELRVDAVVTDTPRPIASGPRIILANADWTNGDGAPLADKQVYRGKDDDLCRIMLTSGTTGEPKAIAFSHRMLFERLTRFHYVTGSRLPSAMRLYSDLGIAQSTTFRCTLFMLWRGGTMFFYGDSPESTVQALDLYKVQGMVAGPFSLAEHLKFYEAQDAFQCTLDHIICLGAQLSKSLSERVRARMCANLFSVYGATEVSTVACAPAHAVANVPGAVGYVVPGVIVEIVDAAGKRLPAGREGIVRIRSPYNVGGYLGDRDNSASAFRDGCFYPGDMGYLTPDRVLVIIGRESTVLNLGGDKVNPERIEQVLLSFPGITQAAAFGILNPMGIEELSVAVVSDSFDERALRAHCERHLPPGFVPLHFLSMNKIPMTETGKIDRRRLVEGVKNK
ncbi:MAG: AMP-binding protein [Rhizobiales bacterium]|nr:AMP-binding protein [Hyphomicrobiales bacterium]